MDTDHSRNVATELVRRLMTGHKALVVALTAVVDVEAGLTALATTDHLTTPCYIGAHPACAGRCSCEDCRSPCECSCHGREETPPSR